MLTASGAAHAASGGTAVRVTVTGLHSTRGQVLACLSSRPQAFPNCRDDPSARKLVVPAGNTVELDFGTVAAGSYAVALVHDENANGRMDKAMMMPKEGFGFSRDAPVRFGPPSFRQAAFAVGEAPVHQTIHMRYMF